MNLGLPYRQNGRLWRPGPPRPAVAAAPPEVETGVDFLDLNILVKEILATQGFDAIFISCAQATSHLALYLVVARALRLARR